MSTIRFDFTDRVAIVSGAAQGIGLELSRFFASQGADVVMVGRDAPTLSAATGNLNALPVIADVSSTKQIEEAVTRAVARFGRIDVLINNAGVLQDRVLWKLTDEDWDTVLATHAGGTFRFTRACVPHFRAQGRGRVVNVPS
jgi:3-oxoacyl-[acyl-carrier protein] reductase